MITHWEGGIIMSMRLKKLLALSLSISVAATGLFNDIGVKMQMQQWWQSRIKTVGILILEEKVH